MKKNFSNKKKLLKKLQKKTKCVSKTNQNQKLKLQAEVYEDRKKTRR